MTGYGAGSCSTPLGEILVEVKSLNNRFLDLNMKIPRELNSAEMKLRDEVKRRLRRGKVDVYVRWTPSPTAPPLYEINANLLRHYAKQIASVFSDNEQSSATTADLSALLQLPGVVTPAGAAGEEGELPAAAKEALGKALTALEEVRGHEGQELAAAIEAHLTTLEQHRQEVERVKDDLLADYRDRLKDRIEVLGKTLDASLDPVRVETEIMFFADKSDITEELVRLDAHLKAFRKMLREPTPAKPGSANESMGKPMDFLVQELLREANTIGNKARGVSVAQRIVLMKSEIEKIREQVQNLE